MPQVLSTAFGSGTASQARRVAYHSATEHGHQLTVGALRESATTLHDMRNLVFSIRLHAIKIRDGESERRRFADKIIAAVNELNELVNSLCVPGATQVRTAHADSTDAQDDGEIRMRGVR